MKVHNGFIPDASAKVYNGYPLMPKLPGAGMVVESDLPGTIVEPPSSRHERDEMALNGLVFELHPRPNPDYRRNPDYTPNPGYSQERRSSRRTNRLGHDDSGREWALETPPEDLSVRREPEFIGGARFLPANLIAFENPDDVRTALRDIVSHGYRSGNKLLAVVRQISGGELDITDSAATSSLFDRIVVPEPAGRSRLTDDAVHDVETRFRAHLYSSKREEDVLMLSAHLAWYWGRVENYDLEARYIAMMGYRVFGDQSDARVAAMPMLGNIDALYDRMAEQGSSVDDRIRALHDAFLETVHARINATERERSVLAESARLRPPRTSLANALRPHVCRSEDGLCMHSSHLVDQRGWGDGWDE